MRTRIVIRGSIGTRREREEEGRVRSRGGRRVVRRRKGMLHRPLSPEIEGLYLH